MGRRSGKSRRHWKRRNPITRKTHTSLYIIYLGIFFSREQNERTERSRRERERTKRFCSNTKMMGQTTVFHELMMIMIGGVHDGISSLFCRRCVVVAERFLGVRYKMPTFIPTSVLYPNI